MDIPSLIQHYGYLAVAIGTFLEGETVLVTAGIAAHHGYLSLPAVIAVATFASFLGDQLFFYVGRLHGRRLLTRFPSLGERMVRANALLHRHHVPIILVIRFLYGLRVAGPIAIGMSGVPRLRFLVLNLIGAIVWAILISLAGYGIGQGIHIAREVLGIGEGLLLTILVVSGIIVGLIIRSRRRRHGMRVLLVEDDPMIGQVIQDALQDASYAADWVRNGQTALTTVAGQHYDLVLLDLGLPGKDGLDILATLRSREDPVPVLIITARDALDDRLRGLDGGADDYILKPFDMAELLARMRAVLRRKNGQATPLLGNGIVSLDPTTKQATVLDGPSMQLSNREFSLLQALLIRPGAILSRTELEDRLYGWGEEVESNAVEFLIHALRRKLGQDIIRNVRGVGWMVSKGA